MTEERRPRSPGLDPAFPNDKSMILSKNGISKRDHFSSLILAGLNANPDPQFAQLTHIEMIERSIEQADLLIEMLARADREDTADDVAMVAIRESAAADQLANLVR